MGGYRITDQHALYFVTLTTVGWMDVFTRLIYKNDIIESLAYCKKSKGLQLYAYVIMSNHLHLIVSAEETHDLSDILRDFKKYTAKKIINRIRNETESRKEWMLVNMIYHAKYNKRNHTYQFWQQDNHPIRLESPKWIETRLNYIHMNPVRAGVVDQACDYRHSSARSYYEDERECLLDVMVLEYIGPGGYYYYPGN
ncbi:MAG: transposase [Bacteroidia bacterium]|nr:transposase [Bacteroidia bacterium]